MKKILITLFSAVIAFAMTSCADELTYDQPVNKKPSITIQVNQSKATTRADYSGIGVSVTEVTVSEGDVIGVYAVDKAGNIVSDNVAFTYDGKAWGTATDVPYDKSYSYYAYYPHVENPYKPDFSKKNTNEIFAQFISDTDNKFHSDDQSTKEKFTACDLMVSELGVLSGKTTVSFSLYHKKALAILTGEGAPFTSGTYIKGDKAYYMMKPSTPTNVAGFTLLAEGGKAVSKEVPYDAEVAKKYCTSHYLTFIPIEDSTFGFSRAGLSYSLDNGETWTELAANGTTPIVKAGQQIMWKNNTELTPSSSDGIGTFTSSKNFDAQGNTMSLLFGDNFVSQTSLSGKDYAFCSLFQNSKVRKAEKLVLPATTLVKFCYADMFYGCTSLSTAPKILPAAIIQNRKGVYAGMFCGCTALTTAPELPATSLILASNCYAHMFKGCTSLTTAPELPATDIRSAEGCYQEMFQDCTLLTEAPELPATTLADFCYQNMFSGCTSLATAPKILPATTLASKCYYEMFRGCTSLTNAPELPATTLVKFCYDGMFEGCTSLTTAPKILPATTLEISCYSYMFRGCTSLTTAPELPATKLANYCYQKMFSGCTNLNYVKMLATDISAGYSLDYWLNNVSTTGTFVKAAGATIRSGVSGIPNGWTVQETEQ